MRRFVVVALLVTVIGCRKPETPVVRYSGAPVILISIDTLRADHLPAYGYKGVATPNIDKLRGDGILFTHAYSHVPLTLPSHVSILTGELPPDNGVRNNIGFPFDAAKHPTLPQLLKKNGYATGAAVSAYVLRGNTGLAAAFDAYDDDVAVTAGEALGKLRRPGIETEAVAERWIDGHANEPFFYFLHLFEPHAPYDSYDGQIAAADAIIGKFIDHLKSVGIYDRAIVVLLSDHGEGLGQHGEDEHGIFLYMEDIHVPLILKLPGSRQANSSVDAPAQLIDVFPTLASLTGVEAQPGKGHSLLDLAALPPRRIYSETLYPRIHLGWSDLRSLVDDKFHFIDAPRAELYATSEAAERKNVVGNQRRVAAAMRKDLEPFSREMPAIATVDPEEAKKLEALGYLGSAAGNNSGPLPDPKDAISQIALLKDAGRLDRAGRSDEAIAGYRRVIAMNPRLTDAWTLLAQHYERIGRYEDALDTYKRCIEVAPSVAGELALSIANVDLLLNRFDEAIANADAGMKVNPGNAHLIAGRAKLSLGRLDEATADALASIGTFNYKPAGHVLLAQVYVKQRRLAEAAGQIDEALAAASQRKLEPPPLLFYVRGDIEAFNEEIRRFPGDRQAYANLTVIYLLQGDRASANQTMERLVRANPDRRSYELAAKTFAELHDEADAQRWRRR
jgi:tetratricopeptide (TPR) repeat protein